MSEDAMVVILMGSKSDHPHAAQIAAALDELGVPNLIHIASAHKHPGRLLEILDQNEATPNPKVFITIAGRSDALSGMVDANVLSPVIACPPIDSSYAQVDIWSSLRMPSGVAPMVILEPRNAALAAGKILALVSPSIAEAISRYKKDLLQQSMEDSAMLRKPKLSKDGTG